MAKKVWALALFAAWIAGLSLLATPSTSQADTLVVNDIIVTVGNTTYCGKASSVSDSNTCFGTSRDIWSAGLGANGVSLADGQSLVLTQTGGALNFDSSDNLDGSNTCNPSNNCGTTLQINQGGIGLSGTGTNILANNNLDVPRLNAAAPTHNEAADWSLVGGVGLDSQVYFGYADNLHSDACADASGNCFPNFGSTVPTSLFFASATNTFIGAGASGAGNNVPTNNDGFHCNPNNTTPPLDCFDAGAIMIYNVSAVPEPSSVILASTVLVGLAGMALRRRRQYQQQ